MENNLLEIAKRFQQIKSDLEDGMCFGIDIENQILSVITDELLKDMSSDYDDIKKALINMYFLGNSYGDKNSHNLENSRYKLEQINGISIEELKETGYFYAPYIPLLFTDKINFNGEIPLTYNNQIIGSCDAATSEDSDHSSIIISRLTKEGGKIIQEILNNSSHVGISSRKYGKVDENDNIIEEGDIVKPKID